MDKGNVASGRDRDAHRVCAETRIAAGRRVESPTVGHGMGAEHSESTGKHSDPFDRF